MTETPFDVSRAHRWFAVECNNLAWDLIESGPRSAEDQERLIHAAHAACHHWLAVGTPVNHQRAQCLLATAYAAAALPEAAVRHAERCVTLSGQTGDAQNAFDRACAWGCAARAYSAAGQREKALAMYALAAGQAPNFEHPDDKAVFEKLYPAP
jgi:tetratricopeptide (TPR) repeat protein